MAMALFFATTVDAVGYLIRQRIRYCILTLAIGRGKSQ
jgi:hypothetical protein